MAEETIRFVIEGDGGKSAGPDRDAPPGETGRSQPTPTRTPPPERAGEGESGAGPRQNLPRKTSPDDRAFEDIMEWVNRSKPRAPSGGRRDAPSGPEGRDPRKPPGEREGAREEKRAATEAKRAQQENARTFSEFRKGLDDSGAAQRLTADVFKGSTNRFNNAVLAFAVAANRGRGARFEGSGREGGPVESVATRVGARGRLAQIGSAFGQTGRGAVAMGGAVVAAGVAAAGVTALGVAAVKSVDTVDRWRKGLEESARSLAPLSGRLSVAMARLDVHRLQRDLQRASALDEPLSAGVQQSDRLERALHDLSLKFADDIIELKTAVVGVGAKIAELLNDGVDSVSTNEGKLDKLLLLLEHLPGIPVLGQTIAGVLRDILGDVEKAADTIDENNRGIPGDFAGLFGTSPDFVVPGFNDNGQPEVFGQRANILFDGVRDLTQFPE